MTERRDADVLIVGAGMAGLACAAALQNSGLRIAITDPVWPGQPADWSVGYDARVSALSMASQTLLTRLGAWEVIEAQRLTPYTAMEVWDSQGSAAIRLDGESLGEVSLGAIVENRVIVLGLQATLMPNVQRWSQGVAGIASCGEQWRLTLSDGSECTPALVIGADGARSFLREHAGLRTRHWSYGQQAIVTTVHTTQPHAQVARQVFRPTGPLAFLPLPDQPADEPGCLSSIVWSLDTDAAEQVMSLSDDAFCERLTRAFESRLGRVYQTDRRWCFPLQQLHASEYVRPGLALIGDAAHVIHPLAGQGINLGFLDAAVLAEEVAGAVDRGLSPGNWLTLRRYQRRRKPHNLATMAAMEGFKRLFGTSHWTANLARNSGMRWVASQQGIKNALISQAMGLGGDLPRLAQRQWISGF